MIEARMGRRMSRRWLVGGVLAGLLAIGVAAALAASSAVPSDARLPASYFGPRMARAEVIVVTDGVVHDFRVDQGRLRGIGADGLLIAERDGTRQTVPVAPTARVTLNGAPSSLAALRPGMHVLAVRDGDASASIVKARTVLVR
jgi:hypothetical protein